MVYLGRLRRDKFLSGETRESGVWKSESREKLKGERNAKAKETTKGNEKFNGREVKVCWELAENCQKENKIKILEEGTMVAGVPSARGTQTFPLLPFFYFLVSRGRIKSCERPVQETCLWYSNKHTHTHIQWMSRVLFARQTVRSSWFCLRAASMRHAVFLTRVWTFLVQYVLLTVSGTITCLSRKISRPSSPRSFACRRSFYPRQAKGSGRIRYLFSRCLQHPGIVCHSCALHSQDYVQQRYAGELLAFGIVCIVRQSVWKNETGREGNERRVRVRPSLAWFGSGNYHRIALIGCQRSHEA